MSKIQGYGTGKISKQNERKKPRCFGNIPRPNLKFLQVPPRPAYSPVLNLGRLPSIIAGGKDTNLLSTTDKRQHIDV